MSATSKCGQALRDLGKLDRGGRAFVGWAIDFYGFIRIRVGDERIDHVDVGAVREV